MKVYISADMEGLAGVVLPEQLLRGTREYEEARGLLLGEVNAVIAGVREAGAREIIVRDAHGTGLNLPLAELDPRARYVVGASQQERFPGLDSTFDAALLVGYHAMAGTAGAVRDHTMSSADWQEVRLNGRSIGEIGLDAAIFGRYGVPVVLVSGDDKACREASDWLPGVATVQTKTGHGRHTALSMAPRAAQELLQERARQAVGGSGQVDPLRIEGEVEVTVRFSSTDRLDARFFDGVQNMRIDPQTALYRGSDLLDVLGRVLR